MATYYIDAALGSDGNAGTSAGAGNAWQTFAPAIAAPVAAGDLVNVKASATYTLTSAVVFGIAGTAAAGPVIYRGYTATPGDGGKAAVTTSTTVINLFHAAVDYNTFDSFAFSHTGATRGAGIIPTAANRTGINVRNCSFDGCLRAIDGNSTVQFAFLLLNVDNCEIKNGTSHGISNGGNTYISNCFIHNNVGSGFDLGSYSAQASSTYVLLRNVFYGNVNNVRDSVLLSARQWVLKNNTLHSPTTDNFVSTATVRTISFVAHDNIIYHAGTGYGLNFAVQPTLLDARNNAYGANFTSNFNNCPAGINDLTLTGDPCTSAGTALSGFSPNNTTGAGKIVRNAGVNSVDVGAMQHADPVATSTARQPRFRIGTGS